MYSYDYMAVRASVTLKLASDPAKWGYPSTEKAHLLWSQDVLPNDQSFKVAMPNTTLFNSIVSTLNISVMTDKGKHITFPPLIKSINGYINVVMEQGGFYHYLGVNINKPLTVKAPDRNDGQLGWETTGGDFDLVTSQLSDGWMQIVAYGEENWQGRNSCAFNDSPIATLPILTNVSSPFDCIQDDVVAFDYNAEDKVCVRYGNDVNFSPRITSTLNRTMPNTICYMRTDTFANINKDPPPTPTPTNPPPTNPPPTVPVPPTNDDTPLFERN